MGTNKTAAIVCEILSCCVHRSVRASPPASLIYSQGGDDQTDASKDEQDAKQPQAFDAFLQDPVEVIQ